MSIHVGTLGSTLVCTVCADTLRSDPLAQLAMGPFGHTQPDLTSPSFDNQVPTVLSDVDGAETGITVCSGCGDTSTVIRWSVLLRLVVDNIPSKFDAKETRKINTTESGNQGKIVWEYADPVAHDAAVAAKQKK